VGLEGGQPVELRVGAAFDLAPEARDALGERDRVVAGGLDRATDGELEPILHAAAEARFGGLVPHGKRAAQVHEAAVLDPRGGGIAVDQVGAGHEGIAAAGRLHVHARRLRAVGPRQAPRVHLDRDAALEIRDHLARELHRPLQRVMAPARQLLDLAAREATLAHRAQRVPTEDHAVAEGLGDARIGLDGEDESVVPVAQVTVGDHRLGRDPHGLALETYVVAPRERGEQPLEGPARDVPATPEQTRRGEGPLDREVALGGEEARPGGAAGRDRLQAGVDPGLPVAHHDAALEAEAGPVAEEAVPHVAGARGVRGGKRASLLRRAPEGDGSGRDVLARIVGAGAVAVPVRFVEAEGHGRGEQPVRIRDPQHGLALADPLGPHRLGPHEIDPARPHRARALLSDRLEPAGHAGEGTTRRARRRRRPCSLPGRGGPPVADVARRFPQLTLTFVEREIEAVRRLGLEIHPFSIWRTPCMRAGVRFP
jgi:hypothetical protein